VPFTLDPGAKIARAGRTWVSVKPKRLKREPPLGGAGDRDAGEFLQVCDRFLRFAGGSEDGTFVVAESLEPGSYVRGVIHARFESQLQMRAQHGAGNFGDELFHGVLRIAEAPAEIAV